MEDEHVGDLDENRAGAYVKEEKNGDDPSGTGLRN